eukprot:TRINITY_DN25267_c0_g1_i1.p1 TRINITY_DN25267_c0_g1~~TRINITY_DN25267_c0_g1_i1.p1  ORF type:complete len:305 (+),score=51.73 TRINITY_DN25267_c0_g1_i1:64-978(+)
MMKYVGTLLQRILLAHGIYQCPITIKEDGHSLDLHVAALNASLVTSHDQGTSISMRYGEQTRAFVIKEKVYDMAVENFKSFNLSEKELSYDVDLSSVDCSCNAALFFVSMPGYSPNGSIAHGSYNPYYCDANKVGGVWCWEYDSIEANMHTLQSTPHTCKQPAGGYISSCDRIGCMANARLIDRHSMCPDAGCKINTKLPFRLHQQFVNEDGKLSEIKSKMVQGNQTFEFTVCKHSQYLQEMTESLNDMKMVFQLWGTSWARMSWLDWMSGCLGSCNHDTAVVTFSNIEINSLPVQSQVTAVVI